MKDKVKNALKKCLQMNILVQTRAEFPGRVPVLADLVAWKCGLVTMPWSWTARYVLAALCSVCSCLCSLSLHHFLLSVKSRGTVSPPHSGNSNQCSMILGFFSYFIAYCQHSTASCYCYCYRLPLTWSSHPSASCPCKKELLCLQKPHIV
jgi:hypothetical protein